jgi:hypothetical protein
MVSVRAQRPAEIIHFYLVDPRKDPEATNWQRRLQALEGPRCRIEFVHDSLRAVMEMLQTWLADREFSDRSGSPACYLFILGLHRMPELMHLPADDDVDGSLEPPLVDLVTTICERGPEVDIHTCVWADSFATFQSTFTHAQLECFLERVVDRVSQDDSYQLLGQDFTREMKGSWMYLRDGLNAEEPVKFRPYQLPSSEFLNHVAFICNQSAPKPSKQED